MNELSIKKTKIKVKQICVCFRVNHSSMSWIRVGFSATKNIISFTSILQSTGETLRSLYNKIELFNNMQP